jgi:hypothetical protein
MCDNLSISSTGSISVGYKGGAVPLEQALDEVIRELQKHLNMVQVKLREIAIIVDQDPDFKEEVTLSDELDDNLREMEWLFSDLRSMAYDLISDPYEPEDKAWFKTHKAERKVNEKKLQSEHAAKVKEERIQQKNALKEISEMSEMTDFDD